MLSKSCYAILTVPYNERYKHMGDWFERVVVWSGLSDNLGTFSKFYLSLTDISKITTVDLYVTDPVGMFTGSTTPSSTPAGIIVCIH